MRYSPDTFMQLFDGQVLLTMHAQREGMKQCYPARHHALVGREATNRLGKEVDTLFTATLKIFDQPMEEILIAFGQCIRFLAVYPRVELLDEWRYARILLLGYGLPDLGQ